MTMFLPETESHRGVPPRALALSVLALAVPVVGMVVFGDWFREDAGLLIWLTALVPPFLMAYYRGWQGSSVALAAGMVAIAVGHVLTETLEIGSPDYGFLLWMTSTIIVVSVGVGVLAELLKRERIKAAEMALSDVLTGLPNRRHAGIFMDAAFSAAGRGRPLSVVLFDLDEFKEVNDRHGHWVGDRVLERVGQILEVCTRGMDLSARWGGEEFLSILTECDGEGAATFVERVQKLVREEPFDWGRITLSAGIAEYGPGMGSPELLVAAADRALYRAKKDGRDCWRLARGREAEEPTPASGARPKEPGTTPAHDGPEAERGRAPAPSTGEGDAVALRGRKRPPPLAVRHERKPPLEDSGNGPADVDELPGGWERLLLVDDDEPTRQALGRSLRRLGYTVETAADGERALRTLRESKGVDLLIIDLLMPGMSGFTLAERIEEELGPHRILYMSGHVRGELSWGGAPGAAVDFLGKPMTLADLATRVRRILERPVAGRGDGARGGPRPDAPRGGL